MKMALIRVPQPKPTPLEWRNSELERTDELVNIPDYRYIEDLLRYRKELRDWPDSGNYPDVRPAPPRNSLDGLVKLLVEVDAEARTLVQQGDSVTLNITVKNEAGEVQPINDTFGVPVKKIGGEIERTIGVKLVDGSASVSVAWPDSGEYEITENLLNRYIKNNVWFNFERLVFSVIEAGG